MIDELNAILKKELSSSSVCEDNYVFIQSLLNIILSNRIITRTSRYNSTMSIEESIFHSINFIDSINNKYGDIISRLVSSKYFKFTYRNDKPSYVGIDNGQKMINLFLSNTIEDSYTITHESFHYINLDLLKQTENWRLITETISLTAERLQQEYFKKIKSKDYKNIERDTMCAIGIKAKQLDFEVKLIKYYLKYRKIEQCFINSFLNSKNKKDVEAIMEYIEEIIGYNKLRYYYHQRYIIAIVLSSLLGNLILNNPDNINLFIELNDNCNTFSFIESLEYLGLKVVDKDNIILSDDSLNLLDKEYQKRLSKL